MDTIQQILLGAICGTLVALNASVRDVGHAIRYKEMSAAEAPAKPVRFIAASAAQAQEVPRQPPVIIPETLPNWDRKKAAEEHEVQILGYPGIWKPPGSRRNDINIYLNR